MADLQCHGEMLTADDPRIAAFFAVAEQVLPDGIRLDYVMASGNKWKGPVEDRVARVNACLPWPQGSTRNPLFGNGTMGKRHVLAIMSNIGDGKRGRSGFVSRYKIDVGDESDLLGHLPAMLEAIAPAVDAHAGFVHSTRSRSQLFQDREFQQYRETGIARFADDRVAVHDIAWVNYFSVAVADLLGFPNEEDRQRLGVRLQQIPAKGWRFSLTAEPLDLELESHAEITHWAYRRFGAGAGLRS